MDRYEQYKLEWMIAHGYSLPSLMARLNEDCGIKGIEGEFAEWEEYIGFGGEIWACRDEWEMYEGKENCNA